MKNINDNQLNAILQLLAKYNVGIQDFNAVEKMFGELPAGENKKEETPTDEGVV